MDSPAPRVFVSYSHDSQAHKDWVLKLATRLVANGVDVILDQWDLSLGGDLPRFMEAGLVGANRILAVCTSAYTEKANMGSGGVGYEKMILTAQLMQDTSSERIIPVVRDNEAKPPVPTFLASKVYVDFRDDAIYESSYAELVREIHGHKIRPRPRLGTDPFAVAPATVSPQISFSAERYVSPALTGTVVFDYSNNNGRYVVGSGDMAFETAWSGGSSVSIHAYSDPPSIRAIALAVLLPPERSGSPRQRRTPDCVRRARAARLLPLNRARVLCGRISGIRGRRRSRSRAVCRSDRRHFGRL